MWQVTSKPKCKRLSSCLQRLFYCCRRSNGTDSSFSPSPTLIGPKSPPASTLVVDQVLPVTVPPPPLPAPTKPPSLPLTPPKTPAPPAPSPALRHCRPCVRPPCCHYYSHPHFCHSCHLPPILIAVHDPHSHCQPNKDCMQPRCPSLPERVSSRPPVQSLAGPSSPLPSTLLHPPSPAAKPPPVDIPDSRPPTKPSSLPPQLPIPQSQAVRYRRANTHNVSRRRLVRAKHSAHPTLKPVPPVQSLDNASQIPVSQPERAPTPPPPAENAFKGDPSDFRQPKLCSQETQCQQRHSACPSKHICVISHCPASWHPCCSHRCCCSKDCAITRTRGHPFCANFCKCGRPRDGIAEAPEREGQHQSDSSKLEAAEVRRDAGHTDVENLDWSQQNPQPSTAEPKWGASDSGRDAPAQSMTGGRGHDIGWVDDTNIPTTQAAQGVEPQAEGNSWATRRPAGPGSNFGWDQDAQPGSW